MRYSSHLLWVLLLGAVVFVGSVTPTHAQPPTFVDVFVLFTSRPGPAEEALVRAAGGSVRHRYTIVDAIAARLPQQALTALQRNPNVRLIEPDIEVQAVHIDGAVGTELGNSWGVDRLDAEVVQAAGITGSGVRVAVIDSGSGPHTELAIAPQNRLGCIAQSCKAGSGAGYDDDNGHGTHVAGIVAAQAGIGNGGVVGMAPSVTLISLKVLNAGGSGSYSDIVATLDWLAASNGNQIQVANFSLGSSRDPGVTVRTAFDNAYNVHNVLSIAAAGNSGNPGGGGNNVIYPARYDSAVAVAATDRSDRRASFSSTGPKVELAAPGVGVNSTYLNNGYASLSGTSMATPHASGAAALAIAKTGAPTTNSGIRSLLQTTAKDLGASGRDSQFGFGLVDPRKATGNGSLDTAH